jgi:hypothetical protein
LAYIYNDYSKYAIKDAVMSPQEYWALQGTEQQFLKAKAIFDVVIHNN